MESVGQQAFRAAWTNAQHHLRKELPLPDSWRTSIRTFETRGLDRDAIIGAVHDAVGKHDLVGADDLWVYFCGICWATIRDNTMVVL